MNLQSLKSLKQNEVLFFTRFTKDKKTFFELYYSKILKYFDDFQSYQTISEYKSKNSIYIDLYKYLNEELTPQEQVILERVLNYNEVISRCRGLRVISHSESIRLINSCTKFFINFFKENNYKLIVSIGVDNYVTDIMTKVGQYYGVKSYGIANFFLYPKYQLMTVYGENNDIRTPSNDEVEDIYNFLSEANASPLAFSRGKALRFVTRVFISYYYRYIVRYLIKYKIFGNIEYEYRFAKHMKLFHNLFQIFNFRFFDKVNLENLKYSSEKYVYMPLHFYPENTIDYWTNVPIESSYLEEILRVIKHFESKGVTVVLKEHPAFYLSREIHFYKKIKENKNVKLLAPFVTTQTVLKYIKNVVVWNGSSGVEAIFLGAKVSVVCENYYSKDLISINSSENANELTVRSKKELIRYILQSTID